VGNRFIVVRILDAAGNIMWQAAQGSAVTAGQTTRLALGAGIATATVANPLMQYIPLPVEFTVPPGAQVQVFDNAGIDNTDTVAMVATISQ
jgi:hypothetical protein